jgi:hypothetical protein
MKVKRIQEGIYKIKDSKGTWIAMGGFATINGKWTAYDSSTREDCETINNWAIEFDTFKQLKQYAKNN